MCEEEEEEEEEEAGRTHARVRVHDTNTRRRRRDTRTHETTQETNHRQLYVCMTSRGRMSLQSLLQARQ